MLAITPNKTYHLARLHVGSTLCGKPLGCMPGVKYYRILPRDLHMQKEVYEHRYRYCSRCLSHVEVLIAIHSMEGE